MKKLLFTSSLLLSGLVFAADQEVTLVIENHQMKPSTIEIPADTKIKLIMVNKDNSLLYIDYKLILYLCQPPYRIISI